MFKTAFIGGIRVARGQRKRTADAGREWQAAVAPESHSTPASDYAVNFFARCILETSSRRVVEIGSWGGERIKTLKRLFPHIEASGLDVAASYQKIRTDSGVTFAPYSLDFLDDEPGLVVCRGTLTCMTTIELSEFAALSKKWSVAFAEPWPMTGKFGTRSKGSWYHNYPEVFGLICNPSIDTKHSFSLGMAEFWLHGFSPPRHNVTEYARLPS